MRIDPLSDYIFDISELEEAFFPENHEREVKEAIPAVVAENS
jgi:hypothetical protein